MIGLQLIVSFILIFAIAYFFGTIFPIIKRNLLIPLTLIYIGFFMLWGKYLHAPPLKNPDLIAFVKVIKSALGFDMADIVYWFILFFISMLVAGILLLIFDLFMRDRAGEIFGQIENTFSLYGVRNILVIVCFLIPIVLFAGMYYKFITSQMMFLGILSFTSAQLEVIYQSAKRSTIKVNDKNVYFLTTFSIVNALLLFIFMIALVLKNK